MHWIDLSIFAVYILVMLSIGLYFYRKNKSTEDFYVGGRDIKSWHVGLSVVATDVGGGFSIGLGGLGFIMGLSGSWLLFTGLLGAWISAVILIPKVKQLSKSLQLMTFPQLFHNLFDKKVALAAGIISAIGYTGFTSSQVLAGAKLASASFVGLNTSNALIIMGAIAVIYTVLGGLKAVIYTDTVQWLILIIGLTFIGIPICYFSVGGYEMIRSTLEPGYFSLGNVKWQTFVNWLVTIIPIWFIGMTLYQRIYATRSVREAKKAWFIAGLFEYPVMAFLGVILGMLSKVAFENGMLATEGLNFGQEFDPEMGLPVMLKTFLPVGFMGLMIAAYFSAIMSTADSCLMAASGNILTDILKVKGHIKKELRISQIITLFLGILAIIIATNLESVLDLMLLSYAFMVSGLFIPVLTGLFGKIRNSNAAFISMISGGTTTIILVIFDIPLPFDLDANLFGILVALLAYYLSVIIFRGNIRI